MPYCPKCGIEIKYKDAVFCPGCGHSLKVEKEIREAGYPIENKKIKKILLEPVVKTGQKKRLNTHELAIKLEKFTKRILEVQGYTTKHRVHLKGESGARTEIDIVAEKRYHGRDLKIAVECKNYKDPVPSKDIRIFVDKIRDVGFSQGLFVTNGTFSTEARKIAEFNNISTWDLDKLKEEVVLSETGRLEIDQSYRFPTATPLNINFSAATKLENIQNYRGRVEVSSAKLIWKPYYVISYMLEARRKDPSRKLHQIRDSGDFVINAVDGKAVRFMRTETEGTEIRSIEDLFSLLSFGEKTEDDALTEQLKIEPVENYEIRSTDEYEVRRINPSIYENQAKKIALSNILSRNTFDITYEVKKSKADITEYEQRKFKFVPKPKEVMILTTRLIFVPKWEIKFASGEHEYFREVFASSGDMPVNTIAYCPKHLIREIFKIEIFRKKTIAVCEICGKALCDEHIHQCSVCKKWLGVEHSLKCKNCERFFCKEHIHKVCHICGGPICEDCVIQCPICTQISCKKDMVKCERCGKTVCRKCAKSSRRFFRTKFVCKKCVG